MIWLAGIATAALLFMLWSILAALLEVRDRLGVLVDRTQRIHGQQEEDSVSLGAIAEAVGSLTTQVHEVQIVQPAAP